ncbi:hypothetical protein N7492_001445 [Penicillium capsulatum]|uniref:Partial AB-hydrolase lipase domain-containing protein n=1 Tax=Penicillium capsulatum TaxID=69766 RepID=A0A9W9ITN6_9EURO|nr:hypothetical protein N7492_001445 [Penicillium capsulatum]KAJ6129502.1 hypothetical protein N7512_002282 [Penicillium capsulatum]
MSVTIPLDTLVAPAETDKSQTQHACFKSPENVIASPSSQQYGFAVETSKEGRSVAEKHGQPGNSAFALDACEHPLFPPLPSYGPPTFFRKIQYFLLRVISFILSLCFLTVVFAGALACTAGSAVSDALSRLSGHNPEHQRKFYAEERDRRLARAESDRRWYARQRRGHVDEESSLYNFPPKEGGKDPIVCDVAYYARRVGLDVETFRVQTEDGFIITLWHVYHPREYTALPAEQRRERGPAVFGEPKDMHSSKRISNRRYPVLLIHGLLQSSGTYCTNDDDSLAFYLCKSGYDVWLGNNRCGLHPEHTSLSPSDPRMWSWDIRHLGTLDLAALTSRVLYETGFNKLGLVCHSQGTTETFVALAKEHRPDLGERLSVFCALAPAAYAGPLVRKPYFRFMSILSPEMFRLFFGIHSFIPLMMAVRRVMHPKIYGTMAYWMLSFLFGWSDARWERDLRHRMFQFAPVYVSAESMRWWLGSECFAKHRCILSTLEETTHRTHKSRCRDTGLDPGDDPSDACLGTRGDGAWFGPRTPPFALWVAGSDGLVDGRRLLDRLQGGCEPHVRVVHSKLIEEYEHLDVLWAIDAIEQVGKEVRQVIWTTMPDDVRSTCRAPSGVDLSLSIERAEA